MPRNRLNRATVSAHLICEVLKQRERQPLGKTESDEVANLRCEPRTLVRNDGVVDLSMTRDSSLEQSHSNEERSSAQSAAACLVE